MQMSKGNGNQARGFVQSVLSRHQAANWRTDGQKAPAMEKAMGEKGQARKRGLPTEE